jgi:hypothetical protein
LFFTRFLSLKAILKMTYKFQKKDDQWDTL